jgi:hypothetical protein
MLSANNNDNDHTEREKKVLELYDQGKSTPQSTTRRNSKLILYLIIIMEGETVVGSTIINLYHACFNIYAVHDV